MLGTMTSMSMKLTLSIVWVVAVLLLGLAWQTTAVSGWLTLLAVAIPPPAILLSFWREPIQSTSERIRAALR
jgi:hypothetical protein